MVHEFLNIKTAEDRIHVRRSHPSFAILRDHGDGRVSVFDESADAINHWSASMKQKG